MDASDPSAGGASKADRSSWIDRWVWLLWRRRGTVVVLGVVTLAACALYASRLELRPSFTELLPENAPSVLDLRRITRRMVSTDLLIVAIEGDDASRNQQAADAIADAIRKLPADLVARVKHRVDEERAFFDRYKWLYAELEDLESLRDRLELEIAKKKNPLFVSLDDEEEPVDPDEVETKYRGRYPTLARFARGHIATDTGKLFVVLVWPLDNAAAEGRGDELSARVRRAIDDLRPARRWGVEVTLAGNIQTSIEERAALVDDLVLASTVCTALVLAVILLYFRRLRSLVYVGFPALTGVAAAFAFAEVAYGALNASTAFLGSIILGNGINFPIVFVSRYAEEARRHDDVRVAISKALRGTALPTLVAAGAASTAYASLVLTDFRGFSQFGAIGGVGMLLCWVASVSLLPAACMLWEGRAGASRMAPPARAQFSGAAALLVRRAPGLLLLVGVALSVAAVVELPAYLRDPIEYNFRKLRNRKTQTSGLAHATTKVDKLFGRQMTPAAVLADRRDQVPLIKSALLERDRRVVDVPVLESVETIESVLPGSREEQEKKLAVIAAIRKQLEDPGFKLLDDDDRARIEKLKPPTDLRPIGEEDLPAEIRRRYSEKDGTVGRVLLLYPNPTFSSWRGKDAIRFAAVTREIPLPNGDVVRSASNSVILADMVENMLRDGPRATLFSLLGVLGLVVLLTRSARGTLMVTGSLVLGVLWMVGAVATFDEKVNFLNFVALPITFGIGVDYAVNVFSRYRSDGGGSMADAVLNTGGAVVLCSATTIIGYAALLVADNRGLVSFGALAILGEFACLASGVVWMPALAELIDRRRARATSETGAGSPGGTP
jgi:hypothetical protein